MLIPFFRPDRTPSVFARVNGEAAEAVTQAAVQGAGKMNLQALKEAGISNLVSASLATGVGVFSHVFFPVKEAT